METPKTTNSDTHEQEHASSLTSSEKETTPAVELDELDDELLEEVSGGAAIYSPACVPIPD